MKIQEVSAIHLKGDQNQQTLWFRGEDGDLFIIFERRTLKHFEVTMDKKHLEGGISKSMKFGLVDQERTPDENPHHLEDALAFKKSRIIQFQEEIPKEFIDQCIEIVHGSENLETRMKEAIMRYLSSVGRDDTGFQVEEDFESFREIKEPGFNYGQFFYHYRRSIFLFCFFALIAFYLHRLFYQNELLKSCEGGNEMACANLGLAKSISGGVIPGKSIAKSRSSRLKLLKSSCDQGNMDDCYRYREQSPQNEGGQEQLTELHQKACLEKNHPRGCYYMGQASLKLKEMDKAKEYLEKACQHQFLDSCEVLEAERSYNENLLKCQQSEYQACYLVGLKEFKEGDTINGISSLKNACDHEVIDACLVLGGHFSSTGNIEMAKNYYFLGCRKRDIKSCYKLRFLSVEDLKERRSLKKLYQECQNNREESCTSLLNF